MDQWLLNLVWWGQIQGGGLLVCSIISKVVAADIIVICVWPIHWVKDGGDVRKYSGWVLERYLLHRPSEWDTATSAHQPIWMAPQHNVCAGHPPALFLDWPPLHIVCLQVCTWMYQLPAFHVGQWRVGVRCDVMGDVHLWLPAMGSVYQ